MSEEQLTSQPQSPRSNSMSQVPTFPSDVVYNDTTALNQQIDEDLITVMDQEGVQTQVKATIKMVRELERFDKDANAVLRACQNTAVQNNIQPLTQSHIIIEHLMSLAEGIFTEKKCGAIKLNAVFNKVVIYLTRNGLVLDKMHKILVICMINYAHQAQKNNLMRMFKNLVKTFAF